ncbi:MAG: tRNA (adenosine(37)-N6)-dimethylallyltransferase MiaA [Armatimonadetes bacterium]|nr:tRNA (adenosine(37)-N6)-dimethylallyltransferase MiaA [Armatimonadota bacterium]
MNTLLVIVGPTAVGKTAVAIEVARRTGGEIICADSRTIYRGMNIGTAKPTPEQRCEVPHHLLDVASPDDVFTVARYRELAEAAIADIHARGRLPLLVGGTGLYVRAVVDGLSIPRTPPDWELRARLEEEERRGGAGTLHARLRRVDPDAAARIHPRNLRRIIRALEVHAATGQPISRLQQRHAPAYRVLLVGLTVDRARLYARIADRVPGQLAAGLVEEVRVLLARGYPRDGPAMEGLGYKEMIGYLDGQYDYETAVRVLVRNTRRYAKRQWAWFRRDSRVHWIDVGDDLPAVVAGKICAMMEAKLLQTSG